MTSICTLMVEKGVIAAEDVAERAGWEAAGAVFAGRARFAVGDAVG